MLTNKLYDDIKTIYSEDGVTLLICASRGENLDITLCISSHLIDLGIDVNGVGDIGSDYVLYPIHEAVLHNNVKLVKLLLEKGANLNAVNKQGEALFDLINYKCVNDEMKVFIVSLRNK